MGFSSSPLFLVRPFRSCCGQYGVKRLRSFCALMAALAHFLASDSVPRSSSLNSASPSRSSADRSELIRRESLLISIPRRRPLLPRNSPSSSASAASSSSRSQSVLGSLLSSGSSTLISTLLSNSHSSPCRPSLRSLPPKMGPSSGCSPSSSSRQSSQIGSRKVLWTICRMEH
jgi:hypothetical protein